MIILHTQTYREVPSKPTQDQNNIVNLREKLNKDIRW